MKKLFSFIAFMAIIIFTSYAATVEKPKEKVDTSTSMVIFVNQNGTVDSVAITDGNKVQTMGKILGLSDNTIKEIKQNVYGNLKPIDYPFGLLYGYLGIFIFWVISTYFGVKSFSNGTENKFNFVFWVKDNPHKLLSFIVVTMLILLTLRFISELWGEFQFGTMFTAFLTGLLIDFIIQKIIKLREKFKNNLN